MGIEALPHGALLAVLAMAAASYLTRISGFWMMGHVPLTPRLRRMLDALPGSVVAATVLPLVVKSGVPAALGLVAVIGLMLWRRNEFLAVGVGIAVVALMRAAGF
jgi:uncharacterized membrane protein